MVSFDVTHPNFLKMFIENRNWLVDVQLTEMLSLLLITKYVILLRRGINNKKISFSGKFPPRGGLSPHDLVEKTQVIFFGLRTNNRELFWEKI